AACPGGTWREFYDDFDERVLFYAYERQDAPACLAAADLFLPTPSPDATPELPTLEGDPDERDAQRRADLSTIAAALEQHYDETGTYPTTGGALQTLCAYRNIDGGCALSEYLEEIPIDPKGEAAINGYFYASDGQRFSIFAGVEGSAEPISDDCYFQDSFADRLPVVLCVSGSR
ncbi:MAG: type II secretion system protein GspG, partial [Chloroflexi bacterium]|nr:type II secretion system protein GspG [Chloroflexota bacterium]